MLLELLLEVFFIKIKIKGYLQNLTENTKDNIDVLGVLNKQNIHYRLNNTDHKIIINQDKVTLIRENENFVHKFEFESNKQTKANYYIKEYNTDIDILVMTNKLNISENKIEIIYKIIDSKEDYKYVLEMRNKIWV